MQFMTNRTQPSKKEACVFVGKLSKIYLLRATRHQKYSSSLAPACWGPLLGSLLWSVFGISTLVAVWISTLVGFGIFTLVELWVSVLIVYVSLLWPVFRSLLRSVLGSLLWLVLDLYVGRCLNLCFGRASDPCFGRNWDLYFGHFLDLYHPSPTTNTRPILPKRRLSL